MRRAARGAIAAALLALTAAPAAGQNTRLTIGGFAGAFGNSTVADFDAGFTLAPSDITLTVRSQTGAASRRARVYIAAAATTIGTLPVSVVEWQRSDLPGVWTALSTTPVLVDDQVMGGVPATWTRNVRLRILYPWSTTPPQDLSGSVQFTLEVVAP